MPRRPESSRFSDLKVQSVAMQSLTRRSERPKVDDKVQGSKFSDLKVQSDPRVDDKVINDYEL